MTECLGPIYQWIAGPFRNIVIMYVGLFVLLGGAEIGIEKLKAYMKRREGDRYFEMYKDHM